MYSKYLIPIILLISLQACSKTENKKNAVPAKIKKRLVTNAHPFNKETGEFLKDQYTVLLMHFDKLDQNILIDYSGSDNFGYSSNANLSPGYIKNGLKFDGVKDYVEIGSTDSIAKFDAQTIEFWVYIDPRQYQEYPTILSKDTTTDGSGRSSYEIYLNNKVADDYSYDFMYRVYTDRGMSLLNAGFEWQKLADTKWHYIAAVYDGLSLKLFIDGELIKTVQVQGNMLVNDNDLRLSRKYLSDKNFFNGFIDELRISNIARSDQAIQSYWNTMKKNR